MLCKLLNPHRCEEFAEVPGDSSVCGSGGTDDYENDADCVSGPRECGSEPMCFLPGFCDEGDVVDTTEAASAEECLEACQVLIPAGGEKKEKL